MNIQNTCDMIPSIYPDSRFHIEKWESYMDACVPGAKELCLADRDACLSAGYSWENDFLPVLDAVIAEPEKCREAVRSFRTVTGQLDEKIRNAFGKTVSADIILYVGLCNGAGWVTTIGQTPTVLLGLEKILELGWYTVQDMTGLIVHEAGHLYHAQYGHFRAETHSPSDLFLWKLFTEGAAMVFEQDVNGNSEYFHQDKNGWKAWCNDHLESIKRSFYRDLDTMTNENQRYFGDWVRFDGHGDVGYYLGAVFVRYLLRCDHFDNIINYDLAKVRNGFERFMQE